MADYNSAFTGAQIDANLAKAATAVQPGGLATVATTGAYTDLTGKPTLGTAAATASTDYATAAQGTLAGTAVQPGTNANVLGSGSATDNFVLTANGSGGVAWEAAAGGSTVTDYLRTRLGTVQDVFNMADTWNASGTVFTGIKLNVTDTASAAGSLLMDLQVGGVSRFKVSKGGRITLPTGDYTPVADAGQLAFGSPNTFITGYASGLWFVGNSSVGNAALWVGDGTVNVSSGAAFGFSSNNYPHVALDVILRRDAANTLGQRNGANAQAFNIYNTYTDASNYERGFMRFVSNTLRIGTEKLGTGTARALEFQTDGTTRLTIAAAGGVFVQGGFRVTDGSFVNLSNGVTGIWSNFGAANYIGNESGHVFSLRTSNIDRLTVDTVGSVRVSTALTVATLPATPLVGMIARVTNANAPTVGSTVAGGGAANAMCWYNGTNWTVIGV